MSMEEENQNTRESSMLFHPYVLAGLFIVLLVSIWFSMYTLIGILAFILVLSGFIYLWNHLSVKRIHVTMSLHVSRVFAGDDFTANITVKNDKWLPLVWLDWEFKESRLVSWKGKVNFIMRFMWLLPYQTMEWTVKGSTVHRGVYDIGDITIRSGDGFRFSESKKTYDLQESLYIYPKLLPVSVPNFQPSMQWEVQGQQGGLLEDPLIISGVREYEPGDDWKRFNWWASAKSGSMQTNVYQPIISKKLTIFVDISNFPIENYKYEEAEKQLKYEQRMKAEFESFLSVIASFSVAYHEQGVRIGYASNGINYLGKNQQSLSPEKDIVSVLDSLAQITQKVSPDPNDWMEGNSKTPMSIFCREIRQEHVYLYEANKGVRDIQFYYQEGNDLAVKLRGAATPVDQLLTSSAVQNA